MSPSKPASQEESVSICMFNSDQCYFCQNNLKDGRHYGSHCTINVICAINRASKITVLVLKGSGKNFHVVVEQRNC